jgi:hypothetical protein
MDADDIQVAVDGIRADMELGTTDLETKYKAFATKYPALFEMCKAPDFDRGNFDCIVSLLRNVQRGTMSEYDASVRFGQVIFDKYIGGTCRPP